MGSGGAPLLEVGRVVRAHGLTGEVVVELVSNRPERVEPGARLEADGRSLEVLASRPHQGRHLVRFGGVTDRSAADALRGVVLRAEPLDEPGELWVHELVGSVVVTPDGVERGVVASVQANPASDLLVLDSGALVPLRFVTASSAGRVDVDVPEGLFDL